MISGVQFRYSIFYVSMVRDHVLCKSIENMMCWKQCMFHWSSRSSDQKNTLKNKRNRKYSFINVRDKYMIVRYEEKEMNIRHLKRSEKKYKKDGLCGSFMPFWFQK